MPGNASAARQIARAVAGLALLVAVIVAINHASHAIVNLLDLKVPAATGGAFRGAVLASGLAYALLLAVPFVPGVEIGLALLGMFGPPVVPIVYGATVLGLSVSFLVGRLIPPPMLSRLFGRLGMARTRALVDRLAPLGPAERREVLLSIAPGRLVPFLLKNRYIALALLLNLPGNVIVGGGGGIALIAGISRLFPFPAFLIAIAIAVSPVPILITVVGTETILGW